MKTCEEITGLYEQGKMSRISFKDKIALGTHRSICKDCRNYFKDSDRLDSMLSRKFKDLGNYTFSDSEKQDLKTKLEEH